MTRSARSGALAIAAILIAVLAHDTWPSLGAAPLTASLGLTLVMVGAWDGHASVAAVVAVAWVIFWIALHELSTAGVTPSFGFAASARRDVPPMWSLSAAAPFVGLVALAGATVRNRMRPLGTTVSRRRGGNLPP